MRLAKGVATEFLDPRSFARQAPGAVAVGGLSQAAASAVPAPYAEVAAGLSKAMDLPGSQSTETYRKRFGAETTDPSFLGDLGYRTLGAASDVGSWVDPIGFTDSLYRDKAEQPRTMARGGRVQKGLRRGYKSGGPVELEDVEAEAKRIHAQAKRKRPPRGLNATLSPIEPRAADVGRREGAGLRPGGATVEMTPEAKRILKGKGGLDIQPQPPSNAAPRPEVEAPPKAKTAFAKATGEPTLKPRNLKEHGQQALGKVQEGLSKAKEFVTTKFGKVPTVPTEGATAKKSVLKALYKSKLARLAALGVAGYTGYKKLTEDVNPLAPFGEGLSRGFSAAQEGTQRISDEFQGIPVSKPAPAAKEAPPPTRPAPAQTPEQQAAARVQAGREKFLTDQGIDTDWSRPIPEGFRRQYGDQLRPEPGGFINLGHYGGNADIFGTSSKPGGRINTYTGVGGVGGAGPGERDVTPEMRMAGLRLAQKEKGQLSGIIQAKLASGDPGDLDQARRLATTPEHQQAIAAAEKHMGLKERARYGPFGRSQLAAHEEGLRATEAAAPGHQLAQAKLQQAANQKGFENQIAARESIAKTAKWESEMGDAGLKRFNDTIDSVMPPTIDGKTNPDNSKFRAVMLEEMADKNIHASQISPELIGRYRSLYDEYKAKHPDYIDRFLAQLGIGTAIEPSVIGDIRPFGLREGTTGDVVQTPTEEESASSFASTGKGFKFPFLSPILGTTTASKQRTLARLRRSMPD